MVHVSLIIADLKVGVGLRGHERANDGIVVSAILVKCGEIFWCHD
jgi:hypothetical protein